MANVNRNGTRAERARALLDRLQRGPSLSSYTPGDKTITLEQAERQVRGWAETWILEDLVDLVPELQRAAKASRSNPEPILRRLDRMVVVDKVRALQLNPHEWQELRADPDAMRYIAFTGPRSQTFRGVPLEVTR